MASAKHYVALYKEVIELGGRIVNTNWWLPLISHDYGNWQEAHDNAVELGKFYLSCEQNKGHHHIEVNEKEGEITISIRHFSNENPFKVYSIIYA